MNKKVLLNGLFVLALIVLLPAISHASGSGLPWEGPLQRILDSISDLLRKCRCACDSSHRAWSGIRGRRGLMRKALGIVFGLSIAFSASSFGLSFSDSAAAVVSEADYGRIRDTCTPGIDRTNTHGRVPRSVAYLMAQSRRLSDRLHSFYVIPIVVHSHCGAYHDKA